MIRNGKAVLFFVAGLFGLFLSGPSFAQTISIYRVGDGSAALSTAAAPVFIDTFSTSGMLLSSVPIATTGGSALTAVGNATTEGILSLSQNGTNLVFTGYRKDAGGIN